MTLYLYCRSWTTYARWGQSTILEAFEFLRRVGHPSAIGIGALGELPEHASGLKGRLLIGSGESLQRTPKGNSQ